MNGNGGILLDSVILIDHLNGLVEATEYLKAVGRTAHVSAITRAEVLTGLKSSPQRLAKRFLDCFFFLGIDREAADLATELRRVHRWKLPDAFQAAVAQRNGLQLATRNSADFDPRRHPFVVIPYVL